MWKGFGDVQRGMEFSMQGHTLTACEFEFCSGEFTDVFSGSHCNDQFPWRWESPQGLADLGSAIGLAPQSPGLLGGLRDGTGVS